MDDDDALEAMREVDSAPARPKPPPATRPPPSTARSELDRLFDDDDDDAEEMLREMDAAPAARPAPVVDPLDALLDDEMDFDALDAMREAPAATAVAPVRAPIVEADLFDDLDDDALAAIGDAPAAVKAAAPAPGTVVDPMDEDLLLSDADLATLMEAEQSVAPPAPTA